MNKILVVEDIAETGQWLVNVVSTVFPEAAIKLCVDYHSVLRDLQYFAPDLSLVDISLPDGNGLNLISPLLDMSPNSSVIMTTIIDDQNTIFKALQYGATGYLLKNLSEYDFSQKLQGILKGEPPLSPCVARKILKFFEKKETIGQKESGLSQRELEILSFIAKGFSRKEVSRLLHISQNTVATHVKNIYQKLNIKNRAEAVTKAYNLGLLA